MNEQLRYTQCVRSNCGILSELRAADATTFSSKIFWAKLTKLEKIWLDLGKINVEFGQN